MKQSIANDGVLEESVRRVSVSVSVSQMTKQGARLRVILSELVFGEKLCLNVAVVSVIQSVAHRIGTAPLEAQMSFVTYTTGKWLNPFADKSGAYLFLPDGPSRVFHITHIVLVYVLCAS